MSTTVDTGLEAANTPFTVAGIFDTADRSISAVSALKREVIPSDHITIVAPAAPQSAGSLVATLMDQGVPQRQAESYTRRVDAGATLVTVNADTIPQANAARQLLIANGGTDEDSYRRGA
jgi:hypothetical protein